VFCVFVFFLLTYVVVYFLICVQPTGKNSVLVNKTSYDITLYHIVTRLRVWHTGKRDSFPSKNQSFVFPPERFFFTAWS
jgi:hypothetical protein